jgi:hypothetical protein
LKAVTYGKMLVKNFWPAAEWTSYGQLGLVFSEDLANASNSKGDLFMIAWSHQRKTGCQSDCCLKIAADTTPRHGPLH